MYYEAPKLHLSVAGLEVIKPPTVPGRTGVFQRCNLVAEDGPRVLGFNIYPEIGTTEPIRTYLKKIDSGVSAFAVCQGRRPTDESRRLAMAYGVRITCPGGVEALFAGKIRLSCSVSSGVPRSRRFNVPGYSGPVVPGPPQERPLPPSLVRAATLQRDLSEIQSSFR